MRICPTWRFLHMVGDLETKGKITGYHINVCYLSLDIWVKLMRERTRGFNFESRHHEML
jgi:hypothetical protein